MRLTIASAAILSLFSCVKSKPEGATVVAQIVAAKDTTCARTIGGDVYCWGDDAFTSATMSAASLPKPTRTKPTLVAGVKGAKAIDVGASIGCAIDASGALLCWQDRTADQDGPAPPMSARPTGVTDALDVSLGLASTSRACVRKKDRTLTCLAYERYGFTEKPSAISGVDGVDAFGVGDKNTTCVVRQGKLACWGSSFAKLKPQSEALAAPPLLEGVKDLSVGSMFACAVDARGAVTCFGSDNGAPPSTKAKLVRSGANHACLLAEDGSIACWGDNRFNQLGTSTTRDLRDIVDIAVGEWHTCALERSGRVKCWGRNERGQLGIGKQSTSETTPSEVTFP